MRNLFLMLAVVAAFFVSPLALAEDPPAADPVEEAAEAPAEGGEDAGVEPVLENPAEKDEVSEAPAEDGKAEAPTEEVAEVAKTAEIPTTDEEALQAAVSLIQALKDKQWPLAVGLFLSLVVYLVNRFSPKDLIPDRWEPLVSFGVGAASALATAIFMGQTMVEATIAGLLAGLAAVGGWEVVLRMLMKKEPTAPAAAEE